MEIWKDIEGYEGLYLVSNKGRIKRLPQHMIRSNGAELKFEERIMTKKDNGKGYHYVTLHKFSSKKDKKNILVHRLVAIAFLQNPHNYKFINHIDGNKHNNEVNNLEWCSREDNMQHAYRNKNMFNKNCIPIIQLDENMNEVARFMTIRQASEITGYYRISIGQAIKNKNKYKGYYWKKWNRSKEIE